MKRHKEMRAILNAETRRLQQVLAIVVACHAAAENGTEFDMPDVLAVVIALLGESLRGIDQLQLAGRRHGRLR